MGCYWKLLFFTISFFFEICGIHGQEITLNPSISNRVMLDILLRTFPLNSSSEKL